MATDEKSEIDTLLVDQTQSQLQCAVPVYSQTLGQFAFTMFCQESGPSHCHEFSRRLGTYSGKNNSRDFWKACSIPIEPRWQLKVWDTTSFFGPYIYYVNISIYYIPHDVHMSLPKGQNVFPHLNESKVRNLQWSLLPSKRLKILVAIRM